MNQIYIENQIYLVLNSDPEKIEELASNLIYYLIKTNDSSNLKLIKQKIGLTLYKRYCNVLISKIKETI